VVSRERAAVVALLAAAAMTVAGCGTMSGAGGPVQPLAKTGQTPGEPAGSDGHEPALLVAFDERTAAKLWATVGAGQLAAESDPAERGRHGELDEVDFAEQAVVLWQWGESGSCPDRLERVFTRDDGVVVVELTATGGPGCTDDFAGYVLLAAVDRAALPESLPARGELAGGDGEPETFEVVDASDAGVIPEGPATALAALPDPQRARLETLAIHPAWTVRNGGVLARPDDTFAVPADVAGAELPRGRDRRPDR
jgi:predicted small secreted protein